MKLMANPVATLALTVFANTVCMSLLLFTILAKNSDQSQYSDVARNRIDSFVEYIDTKTNRISEKQDSIGNDMNGRMSVLENRVKLLQGRRQ